MSNFNGTYGNRKPANITADDCDIFYHYRPSRSSESTDFKGFKKLDSNNLKQETFVDGDTKDILSGVYNLKLPLTEFNQKGFYTVYITPRKIKNVTIADVGQLYGNNNIRGIILDTNSTMTFPTNSLVGYRIEYLDDENKRMDYDRIITSNNYCEPMYIASTEQATNGIQYKLNVNGSLIYCTVTPSLAMSFNAGNEPFIGKKGQAINLINTKFNPVMIEIELVDDDIETLSTLLKGKQIRNLDKSLITTFDENDGIFHQVLFGTITDEDNQLHHEFKIPLTNTVDATEKDNLETIENNI